MEKHTTEFFAAANTEHGFVSLFEDLFSPEDFRHIYILKGGPGTGKSTLMRAIGKTAQEKGYETEYVRCSSDTDSLDGVIIPSLGVAVLDGTAPHMTDPIYPGAIERIVNLGEAFDTAALEKKRDRIASLIGAKAEAYRTAYRYLAAAGVMEHERDAALAPAFLTEKATAAAKRLVLSFRHAEKGKAKRRYLSAIGTGGAVTLDTLENHAKKIYVISGKNGIGYRFMDCLYHVLLQQGLAMTVCPSPLTGAHIEAIFLSGEDVLFIVKEEECAQKTDKIINGMRFVSKEKLASRRKRLRFAEKCAQSMLEGALSSLREAGALHAETEKIYGACMDFSKVDTIKMNILSEIFANNV